MCRKRWWQHDRMDGVTAASWQNGYFTRHRTDLPYRDRLDREIESLFSEHRS
jgi:hypothetical protein